MGTECSASFGVNFILSIDADVTLTRVSVEQQPGFVSIWYWSVYFTYVTGDPPATAFRLNSADGLTGTFSPRKPKSGDNPLEVRNGVLFGTVQQVIPEGQSATYNGTVTIIQA